MNWLLPGMLAAVLLSANFAEPIGKLAYADQPQKPVAKTPEERGILSPTSIDQSELARKLMNMSDAQVRKLEEGKKKGLLELKPLVLPTEDYIVGKNTHFGWPVATSAGETLVVIYLRRRGHSPPKTDQHSSGCMMIRSLDGGRTWSKPFDLRHFAKKEDGSLPDYSKGMCIATTRDDAIVLGHEFGTFRSEDQGATWQHFEYTFNRRITEDTSVRGAYIALNCPRLIDHPEYGLVRLEGKKFSYPESPWRGMGRKMYVAYSKDGGRTWKEDSYPLPIVSPAEPAMLLHKGALIIIGRLEDDKEKQKTTGYLQYWSKPGWFPVKGTFTNIRPTGSEGRDTVDLSFNPVTERFEVVASDREGGGIDGRRHVPQSLNLWSIDPDALLAGSAEWRFEGCLFEREERFAASAGDPRRFGDGLHPAAAVIDTQQGVQHIFVYMGSWMGPAGIFHLTRTLDTAKLAAFLKNQS